MKALSSIGIAEQASGDAAPARDAERHKAHGHSSDFRQLLGNALKHAHRPDASSHGSTPRQDGAAGPSDPSLSETTAAAAEAEAKAAGGEPSQEIGHRPSRRAPGRKRRHGDAPRAAGGTEPGVAQVAAAAAQAAATNAARIAAPARAGTARLASTEAAKEPLAAPAHAKSAPAERRDREKPHEREPARALDPSAPAGRSEPASLPATAQAKPAARSAAAEAPARAQPPLPPPPSGQDVGGAVLRNAAHLRVEGGPLGDLSLHLRVLDGSLHLRVDGDAAHVVETRAPELSRALAGEGLRLAPIEVPSREGAGLQGGAAGQGGRQGEERREAWNEAADLRGSQADGAARGSGRAGAAAISQGAVAEARGIHVKA